MGAHTLVTAFQSRDDSGEVSSHGHVRFRAEGREPWCSNTPESRMWAAVLVLWIKDAYVFSRITSLPIPEGKVARDRYNQAKRDLAGMPDQLRTEWTRRICDLAGVEYSAFCRAVNRVLSGKLGLEQLHTLGVLPEQYMNTLD